MAILCWAAKSSLRGTEAYSVFFAEAAPFVSKYRQDATCFFPLSWAFWRQVASCLCLYDKCSSLRKGDLTVWRFYKVINPTLLPEEEIVHVVIHLQKFSRQFVVFYLEKTYKSVCRLLPGKSLAVSLSSLPGKSLSVSLSSSTWKRLYLSVCRLLP
jgi:hypothetical protein